MASDYEVTHPKKIHPCNCTSYNGEQCYNCLNGAHHICEAKIKCNKSHEKSKNIGVKIIYK